MTPPVPRSPCSVTNSERHSEHNQPTCNGHVDLDHDDDKPEFEDDVTAEQLLSSSDLAQQEQQRRLTYSEVAQRAKDKSAHADSPKEKEPKESTSSNSSTCSSRASTSVQSIPINHNSSLARQFKRGAFGREKVRHSEQQSSQRSHGYRDARHGDRERENDREKSYRERGNRLNDQGYVVHNDWDHERNSSSSTRVK